MKPFFISYSAATGAALIGASRPRGIEYGREIRCYEDQHPDQKRHHVYESEKKAAPKMPATAESVISGPFIQEVGSGAPIWRTDLRALSPASFAARAESRPQLSAVQACFGRCSNALHAPVSKERFQSASGAGSAESSAHCAGADVNSQLS